MVPKVQKWRKLGDQLKSIGIESVKKAGWDWVGSATWQEGVPVFQ